MHATTSASERTITIRTQPATNKPLKKPIVTVFDVTPGSDSDVLYIKPPTDSTSEGPAEFSVFLSPALAADVMYIKPMIKSSSEKPAADDGLKGPSANGVAPTPVLASDTVSRDATKSTKSTPGALFVGAPVFKMPAETSPWTNKGAYPGDWPICETPLFQQWCTNYHCLVFEEDGKTIYCPICARDDKDQTKRHRKIAKLAGKLTGPLDYDFPDFDVKGANRVVRAAESAQTISAAQVARIGQILHPGEPVDEKFERALLLWNKNSGSHFACPPLKDTSSQAKHRLIVQKCADFGGPLMSGHEMVRVLEALRVPSAAEASRREAKILAKLRGKIAQDFILVHSELQRAVERKVGFWYWAHPHAYNLLVANGHVWNWENGDDLAPITGLENDPVGDAASVHDKTVKHEVNAAVNVKNAHEAQDQPSVLYSSETSARQTPVSSACICCGSSIVSASNSSTPPSFEGSPARQTVADKEEPAKPSPPKASVESVKSDSAASSPRMPFLFPSSSRDSSVSRTSTSYSDKKAADQKLAHKPKAANLSQPTAKPANTTTLKLSSNGGLDHLKGPAVQQKWAACNSTYQTDFPALPQASTAPVHKTSVEHNSAYETNFPTLAQASTAPVRKTPAKRACAYQDSSAYQNDFPALGQASSLRK